MGQAISTGALAMAQDISGALFGVLCLVSVIMGFLILAHIGGQGLQRILRSSIFDIVAGTLFIGGFHTVATNAQNWFHVG
jgi:hypothetical protein